MGGRGRERGRKDAAWKGAAGRDGEGGEGEGRDGGMGAMGGRGVRGGREGSGERERGVGERVGSWRRDE